MKMTLCNMSVVLVLSLCGCTAPEKTQLNELGKDSSNSLKTLGKDVVNVGQAVTSSTAEAGHDISKGVKNPKPNNDLEKGASNAISTLGKEGDKAEHAMANAIKGIGKNLDATSKSESATNKSTKQETRTAHTTR